MSGCVDKSARATPLNYGNGHLPSKARLAVAFQPFSNVVALRPLRDDVGSDRKPTQAKSLEQKPTRSVVRKSVD